MDCRLQKGGVKTGGTGGGLRIISERAAMSLGKLSTLKSGLEQSDLKLWPEDGILPTMNEAPLRSSFLPEALRRL